mgnify:CR=1 FL=1
MQLASVEWVHVPLAASCFSVCRETECVARVYVCVYPVVKQGRQTISPVDAFVASGYSADAVEPLRVASFSEDAYFAPYLKGEAATPASTNKQPTSSA